MSDDSNPRQHLDTARTTLTIGWGEKELIVPLEAAFAAYTAVQRAGYETALEVMTFYRKLSRTLQEEFPSEPQANQALNEIMYLFAVGASKRLTGKAHEDLVVGFLYSLLKKNSTGRPSITWDEAAAYATALLHPATPFTADGWRKKTERWRKRKEKAGTPLDKVGQRRRGK